VALPNRAWRRPARDRRGFAAMETAMVAPVIILLIMAAVDFGRAYSQSIEMNHALRAGAQYAITAGNDQAGVLKTIRDTLPSSLSAATVTVTCYCGVLPTSSTDLPPVFSCDLFCPTAAARMMKMQAQVGFRPYNFVLGRTFASAFGFDRISGNVTVQNQ